MIFEPKTSHDTVTVHTEKKIKRWRDGNDGPIQIVRPNTSCRGFVSLSGRIAYNYSGPFGYKND
jgi:hypothetical protein